MGQGAAGVWGTGRARLGGDRGPKGGGASHREKAGKGQGEAWGPAPHPTSLPAARLPHLGGGSVSGAAARVCEGWRGANWRPAPRRQGPEGPGGTAGSRGLPHTWAARPPPGPACAATAELPRPGGAAAAAGKGRRAGSGAESGAASSVTSACFRTTLSGLSRFPRSR